MIFKSVPNRVVQKRVKKQGKFVIKVWFKFDADGYAEIDETKVSGSDLVKLKKFFKVVEQKDEKQSLESLSYQQLKKRAKEEGLQLGRISREEIIKELEVHYGDNL